MDKVTRRRSVREGGWSLWACHGRGAKGGCKMTWFLRVIQPFEVCAATGGFLLWGFLGGDDRCEFEALDTVLVSWVLCIQ